MVGHPCHSHVSSENKSAAAIINYQKKIGKCIPTKTINYRDHTRPLNPYHSSLKFLHWFIINERTEYKLLFLTYKVLTTAQF